MIAGGPVENKGELSAGVPRGFPADVPVEPPRQSAAGVERSWPKVDAALRSLSALPVGAEEASPASS